jgi:hypothetical protein
VGSGGRKCNMQSAPRGIRPAGLRILYRNYGLNYTGAYATTQISRLISGPQHKLSSTVSQVSYGSKISVTIVIRITLQLLPIFVDHGLRVLVLITLANAAAGTASRPAPTAQQCTLQQCCSGGPAVHSMHAARSLTSNLGPALDPFART